MGTITGTVGNDTLTGTADADLIQGLAGSDTINGSPGDDRLEGGEANDLLDGELGNDLLFGGDGRDDLLDELGGNDQLFGELGADFLRVDRGNVPAPTTVVLDGGADDDYLNFTSYFSLLHTATLRGGGGNDRISVRGGKSVVISAGAGADVLEIDNLGTRYSISLGEGSDLLTLVGWDHAYSTGDITILDFETGDAGDKLVLLDYLLKVLDEWDQKTNPFATGHLRLVQSGADAALQIDRDGAGDSFATFITFRNQNADAFTTVNLGYPSDGSVPPGETITGTYLDDVLTGTAGEDFIDGRAGDDTINGGAGDDRIEGGEGYDRLNGELGDDVLVGGGTGSDELRDEDGGNDQLFGELGIDYIQITRTDPSAPSTVLMDGGGDNDFLTFNAFMRFVDRATIRGGSGDDWIYVRGGKAVTISAGTGVDDLNIDNAGTLYTISLGGGSDVVRLTGHDGVPTIGSITMLDFETGDTGDKLVLLDYFVTVLEGWDQTTNPFATGHLRLVQSGADVLLRIDRDGGGDGFVTFMTFRNQSAGAFTALNLGGYPSDGSAPPGQTITGSLGTDALTGTAGADVILGLDGVDLINGGAGDDRLEGGEGSDELDGDLGNDLLLGGYGNDQLLDLLGGNDQLLGERGSDYILISRDDGIAPSTVLLDGGDDGDSLSFSAHYRLLDQATLRGGSGDDRITVRGGKSVTIIAGTGNDSVDIDNVGTRYSVSLGDGADVLKIFGDRVVYSTGNITIRDFETGDAGDNLVLLDYLTDALVDWHPETNPFTTGHMRLVQVGADTLLQIDRDGGGDAFATLITFQNQKAETFTPQNISFYLPSGVGSAQDDMLAGTARAEVLWGLGGNDVLDGEGGPDTLQGGTGNDTYVVSSATDVVIEQASEGQDLVQSSISYALGLDVEDLTLTGGRATSGTGNALANVITGNASGNRLDGRAGADRLSGGAGNDIYVVDTAGDRAIETGATDGSDLVLSSVSYTLGAHVERLALTGTANLMGFGNTQANVLSGNAGANRLDGRAGADRMYGGAGNDIYVVDDAGDKAIETSAGDTDLVLSSVSFTIGAHLERLTLTGSADASGTGNSLANLLTGNAGANWLSGAAGDDTIVGGGGADHLHGGTGLDRLTGGEGADGFYFGTALSAAANVDTILDFAAADDTIFLDRDVFAGLEEGALKAGAFVRGVAGADEADRILYDAATGRLFYDADGSGAGAAVLFARVTAGTELGNADIVVYA